jgi:hypothetical protein
MPSAPPKVVSAEVVATQPTEGDTPLIARLSTELHRRLPEAAFIIKIELEKLPEPTGDGWALYVGDTRIPKYWAYPGGIYFKVFDPAFLADHSGKPLRFSHDGQKFVNTGVRLPALQAATVSATGRRARALPRQADVLSDTGASRQSRAGKTPARAARSAAKKPGTARTRKGQKGK